MIFELEDIMDDIYTKYPDFTKGSIDKAVNQCFNNLRKLARTNNDIRYNITYDELFIMFKPLTPDMQHQRAMRGLGKKRRVEQRRNEKANSQ